MTSLTNSKAVVEKSVWFITGCSSGFGRELATLALQRGHRVAVTARDIDDVRDLAALGDAQLLKLDVTDRGQAEAAVKLAEDKFGRIDVLVNNAGIGYLGAIEESEEAEVRRMFEINLFGLARMIHLVLPGMRKSQRGCIVNIASIAGLQGVATLGYYCATKFAVEGVRAGAKLGQWSGGVVLSRGGVKPGHWLG